MPEFVLLGQVTGHFGVKGWVKVKSFTRPAVQILEFSAWYVPKITGNASGHDRRTRIQDETDLSLESVDRLVLSEGKQQRRGLIARFEQFDTREQNEVLIGKSVLVEKSAFAPAQAGEYYWSELIGLRVVNQQGVHLGRVDHLVETGANDVLVVEDSSIHDKDSSIERLLPWTDQVIVNIDRTKKMISVDWDADF